MKPYSLTLFSSQWRLAFAALLLPFLLLLPFGNASAQSKEVIINLAPIDGIPLTPDNIFSFGIQSGLGTTTNAVVKGTLRYRQSDLSFSYSFHTSLHQGMNMLDGAAVHPQWTFSSSPFRELFLDYKKLPEGTYEYCVTVMPLNQAGEQDAGGENSECLYQKSEDLFLINLVDPENNAKLYEHYPVFSWIVNYPFASQLTYRIRVAEIKEGQNTVAAITRNNPVYQESNLPQTTVTYPLYSTVLKIFQPYAWTVDAYYKGILLGGADPWKFTIIEDSEMVEIPKDESYYDFATHHGETTLSAVGELRLKYVANIKIDTLVLKISKATFKESDDVKTLSSIITHYADNLFILDFRDKLQHKVRYNLIVKNTVGREFTIPFTYYNPLFVK